MLDFVFVTEFMKDAIEGSSYDSLRKPIRNHNAIEWMNYDYVHTILFKHWINVKSLLLK